MIEYASYKEETSRWTRSSEQKPYDGYTGAVLISVFECENPPIDACCVDFATYCDGEWYKLVYDLHTGVLRRVPVHGNIIAYSAVLVQEWASLLE